MCRSLVSCVSVSAVHAGHVLQCAEKLVVDVGTSPPAPPIPEVLAVEAAAAAGIGGVLENIPIGGDCVHLLSLVFLTFAPSL